MAKYEQAKDSGKAKAGHRIGKKDGKRWHIPADEIAAAEAAGYVMAPKGKGKKKKASGSKPKAAAELSRANVVAFLADASPETFKKIVADAEEKRDETRKTAIAKLKAEIAKLEDAK